MEGELSLGEDDGQTGGRLSGDVEQQVAEDFTPEVIGRLLEEAECQAKGLLGDGMGAAACSSQFSKKKIQTLIQEIFEGPLSGRQIGEYGEVFQKAMDLCSSDQSCRPKSMAGSRTLFPLPVSTLMEHLPEAPPFLRAVAAGLNGLVGVQSSRAVRLNSTSARVLKSLSEVVRGANILKGVLPKLDFREFLKHRKVDYRGEEIKVARKIEWKAVSLSLPDEVGCLFLRDFCEAGVLHVVDNFTEFLLPAQKTRLWERPLRIMCDKEEWPKVAKGLVDKGICSILRSSEVHRIQGQMMSNGMFSVGKSEYKDGIEVTRLIMDMRPVNSITRGLTGDTATLPSVTSLGSLFLNDDQTILTCSEDIRCFFYLFRVPQAWYPYLSFGVPIPKEMNPSEFGDEEGFLCSRVLPMGYVNSVAIAQHVHRNVVRQRMGSLRPPLGGELELRRDKVFSQGDVLFRVYLDNFDMLRKCSPELAEEIEGTPGDIILQLRESYLEVGLPRHPRKATEHARQAEVQGAWLDGDGGSVCAKPGKVARYVALALKTLGAGEASQRELQILGGGFVYVAMYRRPLLSCLNQIWTMITDMEGLPGHVKWPLRREVMGEISRFLCLLPLSQMDLRLKFDKMVTASDASTQGGGICMTRGLTPFGASAALAGVRGDAHEQHDFYQVLSVGMFDGISALRVAMDCLMIPVAGHISIEKSSEARRVVEAAFPDAIFVEDVSDITLAMCQEWALRYPGVVIILIGAGPPCQGVSGSNSDRKGALRDGRSSLFHHVPRVVELCKKAFPWAQVHFLAENVASMDYHDCETMNKGYDCEPWFVDAAGVSPCHRPRIYWMSWELYEGPGASLIYGSDGRLPVQGEVQLQAAFQDRDFLDPGWRKDEQRPLPTFTTSRPSPVPLRRPAGIKQCQEHELSRWRSDSHRFPPYQYRDENCVTNGSGDFRVPSVREREVMLGFPAGFTKQCMSKQFHDSVSHVDCRLSLLGNSWSVPVVAWLLSCLFQLLGLIDKVSLQEIVTRLTPGKHDRLQSLLLRPPVSLSTKTVEESDALVRKLCGLVSLKGEDILLQSASDVPVRYRLRASVPAALWRWAEVAGWRWKGDPEHINVLELRSVLTTIRWRIEQRQQHKLRCIHLVDSLVVLHALTRGRSSSRKMRRTMMRISAYLLCSGLQPLWAYVDTKQNPADRPSRRFVQKKWLKRK